MLVWLKMHKSASRHKKLESQITNGNVAKVEKYARQNDGKHSVFNSPCGSFKKGQGLILRTERERERNMLKKEAAIPLAIQFFKHL